MDASDAIAVCELSSLDDWAMLELMDRMPLGRLLLFGRTCSRYKQLAERNLSVRRQLGLIIESGDDCSPEFEFNSITVTELDRLAVERILELLPGITSLEIVNNSGSSDVLDELLYLLEGWVDQLESLDVWLMEKIEAPYNALPFFGLINRMSKLKKLCFEYWDSLADTDWTALHLPIIGQLQKFIVSTYNDAGPVMRQLRAHATKQLAKVDILCPFYDLDTSTLLLDLEPHLAICFTQMHLPIKDISFHRLATIFQQCQSIQILSIYLHLLTVSQLNRAMAMLPQLTDVVMWVDFPRRSADRQSEDAAIILGEELEPDTVDSSQLVPLPGVTDLKFLILSSHTDFKMLYLDALYPKLVKLKLYHLACLTCGYHFDDDNMEARRRCLLQLQSETTFGEMFPELCQVTYLDETLAEEDWQPEPPMPLPLLYFVVAYFGIIICRQVGRQLTESVTGQIVAKTALQGLLAAAKKAFKLARSSMQSIIGIARK